MGDIRLVLRANALNGETPASCAARRRLFWVDIRVPALPLFDPATGRDQSWHMPAWIDCYGQTARGATVVDRDGSYWCAVYGAGALRRYDPTGKLEREIRLPVRYPTMPAFGGDGLDTLYVTSANRELSEEGRRASGMRAASSLWQHPCPVSPSPISGSATEASDHPVHWVGKPVRVA
jgi:sugar lactone lactonase YvrE